MKGLFLILILFFSFKSLACSCIGDTSIDKSIKYSDAVVQGFIIKAEKDTVLDSSIFNAFGQCDIRIFSKNTLLVDVVYKGSFSKDTIIIFTGLGSGDCGYNFKVGEKYIIYGKVESYFNDDNFKYPAGKYLLWTSICARTTLYNEIEEKEIRKYLK